MNPGQVPYLASLRRANGMHFCGGAIIRPTFVLTSGQCTAGFIFQNDITVVVGTELLSTGGTRYQSNTIFVHPDYNSTSRANDVGLVRVDREFTFTDLVQPIGVGSATIESGMPGTVFGWGLMSVSCCKGVTQLSTELNLLR